MRTLLAVLLLAGCAANAQDPEAAAARYLAGELIVKFEESTPAAGIVGGQAIADPAADPVLAGYIEEIGDSISLPLAIRQVTSGAEVLLAINVRTLVENALERTRELDGIADAWALSPTEEGGTLAPAGNYKVRFVSGSSAAAAVAEAVAAGAGTDELAAIVDGLSQELELPLLYQLGDGDELELTIDLAALTESAAARLRAMPEVVYVELNQLLGPMN